MNKLLELGEELDRESYEYLLENCPGIADAVTVGVARGSTPEEVRRFVVRYYGANRMELARRCEAAARHLEAQKDK